MKKVYDEKLKIYFDEPDCVDEWLEHICFLSAGYDGYDTVDSLKYLVDEIVEMAYEARKCLKENKLFDTGGE